MKNWLVQVRERLWIQNSKYRDRHYSQGWDGVSEEKLHTPLERAQCGSIDSGDDISTAHREFSLWEDGRHCSQRGTIPWNLLQTHLRDAGRRRSQSVPCQWHKTLRSFWGKFLAAGHCWLPWATRTGSWGRCLCRSEATEKDTPCRGPVQETLHPARTLGNRKKKVLPPSVPSSLLYWHNTKCPRWNICTVHLHDHRAGKEEPEKFKIFGPEKNKNVDDLHNSLSHVCFANIYPRLWLAFSFSYQCL